ncbi:hypothetical protein P389DRAFT_193618 [Cystobasidium minutum MCA 4210]|uniref:uncharacterized protein n=1 Tax=Cystobasidium minutum MCA 4210 TaxID=1397322 RepID=UPI0034CD38E3|eukprot:jgi/Rhomi1/193618/gm1.1832_g
MPGDFRVITRKSAAGFSSVQHEEELLGCILACRHGEVGFIGYFCMFPQYRSQGIGTLLLEDSIQHLRKAGCTSIGLDAEPTATNFYTKYGFKKTGSIADHFVRVFTVSEDDGSNEISSTAVLPSGWTVSEITPKDTQAFEAFTRRDFEMTGLERRELLKGLFSAPGWHLFRLSPSQSPKTIAQDSSAALEEETSYIGVQPDANGVCLGPMYAQTEQHAAILLEYIKARYIKMQAGEGKGERFIIAAPVYGERTRNMMTNLGWKGGAHYYERMWLGQEPMAQARLHDKIAIVLDSGLG